ncbi:hypothetical protein M422DRAFT_247547 [Sphaerobolus stellatus SS14]|nr:hypothetical protein M422DRAFT_247547 [Sphaerobolus stellatus SS14]
MVGFMPPDALQEPLTTEAAAEKSKLSLPSDFECENHVRLGLTTLAETKFLLRMGQANDSLTHFGANIKKWAEVYRRAFIAMGRLKPSGEDGNHGRGQLKELTKNDLIMLSSWMEEHRLWREKGEVAEAEASKKGKWRRELPWIWKMQFGTTEPDRDSVCKAVDEWTTEVDIRHSAVIPPGVHWPKGPPIPKLHSPVHFIGILECIEKVIITPVIMVEEITLEIGNQKIRTLSTPAFDMLNGTMPKISPDLEYQYEPSSASLGAVRRCDQHESPTEDEIARFNLNLELSEYLKLFLINVDANIIPLTSEQQLTTCESLSVGNSRLINHNKELSQFVRQPILQEGQVYLADIGIPSDHAYYRRMPKEMPSRKREGSKRRSKKPVLAKRSLPVNTLDWWVIKDY